MGPSPKDPVRNLGKGSIQEHLQRPLYAWEDLNLTSSSQDWISVACIIIVMLDVMHTANASTTRKPSSRLFVSKNSECKMEAVSSFFLLQPVVHRASLLLQLASFPSIEGKNLAKVLESMGLFFFPNIYFSHHHFAAGFMALSFTELC